MKIFKGLLMVIGGIFLALFVFGFVIGIIGAHRTVKQYDNYTTQEITNEIVEELIEEEVIVENYEVEEL